MKNAKREKVIVFPSQDFGESIASLAKAFQENRLVDAVLVYRESTGKKEEGKEPRRIHSNWMGNPDWVVGAMENRLKPEIREWLESELESDEDFEDDLD
jgi:hypothetical protein